jgi:hypothetical protein
VQERGGAAYVRLEGRLGGEWVEELQRCCDCLLAEPAAGSVTVDLAEVSFIDEQGQATLTRLHQRGVSLVANGPLSRFVVSRIQQENRSGRNGSLVAT